MQQEIRKTFVKVMTYIANRHEITFQSESILFLTKTCAHMQENCFVFGIFGLYYCLFDVGGVH